MEGEEGQFDLLVGVAGGCEDEVVSFPGHLSSLSFVAGVLAELDDGLGDGLAGDSGADEEDQGCFGVAPGQVAQELVECVGDGLGAAPDFALADEDVAVLDADEDVRLADVVEDLAGSLSSKWPFR